MSYINFCLIIFQIWCIYKYIKKLKDTEERLKDNEIDYSDIKLQLNCYEKILHQLDDKIENLKQVSVYITKNEEGS